MQLKRGNKKIDIGNVKKVKEFWKFWGLMFCRREKAQPLLFEFKKPTKMKIHSCFVFFPFVAIWLDAKNKILALKSVKPFILNIGIKKAYSKLLEIPINKRNKQLLQLLDGD